MKKGFFLLEALLACVLISLLAGAMVHYHAQWSVCHKKSLELGKALVMLITLVEQRGSQANVSSNDYIITKKKMSVPAPISSDAHLSELTYPPAHYTEITVSWSDVIGGSRAISAVIGGDDEP